MAREPEGFEELDRGAGEDPAVGFASGGHLGDGLDEAAAGTCDLLASHVEMSSSFTANSVMAVLPGCPSKRRPDDARMAGDACTMSYASTVGPMAAMCNFWLHISP